MPTPSGKKRPVRRIKPAQSPHVYRLILEFYGSSAREELERPYWTALHQLVEEVLRKATRTLLIDIESDPREDCKPYVQYCTEDDGACTIEAVSNRALSPFLPPDSINTLHELGWTAPDFTQSDWHTMPNYHQFLVNDEALPKNVAKILINTLRRAYFLNSKSVVGIAPVKLVDHVMKENPELADVLDFNRELATISWKRTKKK